MLVIGMIHVKSVRQRKERQSVRVKAIVSACRKDIILRVVMHTAEFARQRKELQSVLKMGIVSVYRKDILRPVIGMIDV